MAIFWDVARRSLVEDYRRFGGAYSISNLPAPCFDQRSVLADWLLYIQPHRPDEGGTNHL